MIWAGATSAILRLAATASELDVMRLHVLHETSYSYAPAVENAHHVVILKPAHHSSQILLNYSLHITPAPARQREVTDVYGNVLVYFSLQTTHNRLTVVADSIVATSAAHPLLSHQTLTSPPWEKVRDQFRYRAVAAYNSASEFLFASTYIPRHPLFNEFCQPSFKPGRPLLEVAQDLMTRIFTSMRYDSDSTQINTPAVEALKQRKGVCQDFAHIMVACWRGMGLPARYVSGYMLTNPPPGKPRLVGCDASHAWVSVYCPDAGPFLDGRAGTQPGQWLDFDPTNNRMPGEDYVTLATGRDFLDVSPMRGVIRGGTRHVLKVAVTVEPVPEIEIQA